MFIKSQHGVAQSCCEDSSRAKASRVKPFNARTHLVAIVALVFAVGHCPAVSQEVLPEVLQANPLPLEPGSSAGSRHSARAMFEIGVSYFPRDLNEARRWLQPPASLGYAWAQYYLGKVECAAENFPECAHWLLAAGSQGFSEAGIDLFNLYETGRGVPRDKKSACMWALASGHFDPEDIDECRASLPPADFRSVQDEARVLKSKHGKYKDFDD